MCVCVSEREKVINQWSWGNTAVWCHTPQPHRQINSLIDTVDTFQCLCKINNWSHLLSISFFFPSSSSLYPCLTFPLSLSAPVFAGPARSVIIIITQQPAGVWSLVIGGCEIIGTVAGLSTSLQGRGQGERPWHWQWRSTLIDCSNPHWNRTYCKVTEC